ncbi:hypothetical protein Clacol_005498 [Clathrus columnatus]|uniref:Uncharacterized protein n=1 Tax=Clathrus columnatus TaxID=1419009 RepID=A0AAV5A9I4_9AGAM|nr:hypothetical protein Clacol_005498 [Clathrus columnatus]
MDVVPSRQNSMIEESSTVYKWIAETVRTPCDVGPSILRLNEDSTRDQPSGHLKNEEGHWDEPKRNTGGNHLTQRT